MLRKIVTYLGITVLSALFVSYFVFATILDKKGKETQMCSNIHVTILDSLQNRFISPKEVAKIVKKSEISPIGKNIYTIDLAEIESFLNNRSVIKSSNAAITKGGTLLVEVTQRRPLLRIESECGGFYIDDSEYIFPLVSTFTSYVPVISGHIPIKLSTGYRGKVEENASGWMDCILRFAKYLSRHEFWNAQIQQIYIEKNGDVVLYTRAGEQSIVFGPLDNIETKFGKLKAYYDNIIPTEGWKKYSKINLKYDNQIICTLNEKNKK